MKFSLVKTCFLFVVLQACSLSAAVFTSNSTISPFDTTYDGADIVVSNCVLTIDGPHPFNSVRIAGVGGTLTHSSDPSGILTAAFSITNEPLILNSTNATVLANSNVITASVLVTDSTGTITYTNDVDYVLTALGDGSMTCQRTETSAIPDGATVLVTYNYNRFTPVGLSLTVTNDVEVEVGSIINVTSRGYANGLGAGTGGSAGSSLTGGGGGYGGYGGVSSSNAPGGSAFGFPETPTGLGGSGGSGAGGSGGAGGGSVHLAVGGQFRMNGSVIASGSDATNSRSGGGAGGSIWVSAQSIQGSGAIIANGGAGEPIHGGGGGGGRISLEFQTNAFLGNTTAFGGGGWQRGGAGTIFLHTNITPGLVLIDNGGIPGAGTAVQVSSPANLTIQGKATGVVLAPQTLQSLLLRANSFLITPTNLPSALNLTIQDQAVIEPGASILMDAKGYPQNLGPGSGAPNNNGTAGGGGGHGGYGGTGQTPSGGFALGGNGQDITTSPTIFGSGGRGTSNPVGGGGTGGGVIRLIVNGNLHLDGKISADGTTGGGNGSGGGAGGSVWLTLAGLSGVGAISANGGPGGSPYGGGGSGGRIAVTWNTNSFTGTMSARGGAGVGIATGGAGTIYTRGFTASLSKLLVDNGGLVATNTILDTSGTYNEIIVAGGASMTSSIISLSLSNLALKGNSKFLVANPFTLNASLLSLEPGSVLSSDGTGSQTGSSGGAYSFSGSGGGGHGGAGGRGSGALGGGVNSDSSSAPNAGGGRGGFNSGQSPNGGGALRLNITGECRLDGLISADGLTVNSNYHGGGAGGSVWLTAGLLSGAGKISADGGSGHLPFGGGGGGGRISVDYTTKTFTGNYSAKGGTGFANGGAGTIYVKPAGNAFASLTVDNGGLLAGTNTSLDTSFSIADLRVTGGSWLTSSIISITISNLFVGTNSTFQASSFSSSPMTFNISGNAIIDGLLSGDGVPISSSGNGNGSSSGSGGGGYGGYGGRGFGALGGFAFGSLISPANVGGRGGAITSSGPPGGGCFRLNVTGMLALNGRITANGISALNATNNGGGAGGTIYVNAAGLSGSGILAADGGSGFLPYSGGGGGGRIAIYYTSNSFTGVISAKGGAGYEYGGAGTVYLKANNKPSGDVVIDNGGNVGTNTFTDSFPATLQNLSITGGGVLMSTAFSLNISNLTIGANSKLQVVESANLEISGAAIVAGTLSADGVGNGNTPGIPSSTGSGGGGHGGLGGAGFSGSGGTTGGQAASPTFQGGRGGNTGGAGTGGGGTLRMNVPRLLTLNGVISANGLNATSNNAGGGAGGSVWLTVGGITGAGSISARGGTGHLPNGGGGGGGRIALYYTTNTFTGSTTARGGLGYLNGGAGTVYLKPNTNFAALLLVDNGGPKGTNTSVASSGTYDLVVQNGGVADNIGSPRDLIVHSNGWVRQAGNVIVTRNATIEAGGGVNLDGAAVGSGNGAGLNSTTQAGGGGHGGFGGRHFNNFGYAYDSVSSPSQNGSAGGNGSGSSFAPLGGAGGGIFRLTVLGTLRVDGSISSSGLNGDSNSGGGSGGSVFLAPQTLTGSGSIMARGGNGNGTGGGGGGGRIAIISTTNSFTGSILACGGDGYEPGGAGTIYLRKLNQPGDQLLLSNCGLAGAATPLSATFGLGQDISIADGANGEFQAIIPAISNLTVLDGGVVSGRATDTNLDLAILGDLRIATGALLTLDARGLAQTSGPGAGNSLANKGSGGGYGGIGGASSSGAAGGIAYGSVSQPIDRGSGGGAGSVGPAGGSQGGGALRLSVGHTLTIHGAITVNGGDGIQEDSGGGSGGSIWLRASRIDGSGSIAALGGDGELYGGGGGAGGRIALYSPSNIFAGAIFVDGGSGANPGAAGTIFQTNILPGFFVVSHSPQGIISNTLNHVDFDFSSPVSVSSVISGEVTLVSPAGPVPGVSITSSLLSASTVRFSFPYQNIPGDYYIVPGPSITDLFGQPTSQSYTGTFTISIPAITGTIQDTNGQPIAGVVLQESGGPLSAVTDASGHYVFGVDPGWGGTIVPSLDPWYFIPGTRAYTNILASVPNENYVGVNSLAADISSQRNGTNLNLTWFGISGVSYETQVSTNLVDWVPYAVPTIGTNGPMTLVIPAADDPIQFFRVKASN